MNDVKRNLIIRNNLVMGNDGTILISQPNILKKDLGSFNGDYKYFRIKIETYFNSHKSERGVSVFVTDNRNGFIVRSFKEVYSTKRNSQSISLIDRVVSSVCKELDKL